LTVDRDALADVGTAVRRALSARTGDGHLIDDLTQETLLRVANTDALTDDERRAYAVVTARNLLISHHRHRSVQDRHLHQLVEHGDGADPEQQTIDEEEADAVKSALGRVHPDERDLLVRHEVSGTNLATLAGEAGVSSGAIAMRLARARANLRLEFLLVFRRLTLPGDQCRPVLLALAIGDQRRQAQLGAAEHVEICPVCAALVGPMTERDRRAAAWLFAPLGALVRKVRRAVRTWWGRALALTMLLGAVVGLALVVHVARRSDAAGGPAAPTSVPAAQGTPQPPTSAAAPAAAPVAPPVTATPTTAAAPVPAAPTESTDEATTQPPAELAPPLTDPPPTTAAASPCPPAAALNAIDLSSAVGCDFTFSVVTVVAAQGGGVTAQLGRMSVTIRLLDAPTAILLPGTRLGISGTVVSATDPSHVVVSVNAANVRVGG
jgi:RNA polymerase sigma factor (sigma-70 family)